MELYTDIMFPHAPCPLASLRANEAMLLQAVAEETASGESRVELLYWYQYIHIVPRYHGYYDRFHGQIKVAVIGLVAKSSAAPSVVVPWTKHTSQWDLVAAQCSVRSGERIEGMHKCSPGSARQYRSFRRRSRNCC